MKGTLLLVASCIFVFTSLFAQDVKITGVVKNSTEQSLQLYNNSFNHITRSLSGVRYKAVIDKNGKFAITVPEKSINEWVMEIGGHYVMLYLCVNNELNLTVDFKNGENPVVASGANAGEVNYLAFERSKTKARFGDNYYAQTQNLAPRAALSLRKEWAAFKSEQLEEYRKTHPLSDKYYLWLKTYYKYEPYERTLVENVSSKMRGDSTTVAMLVENGLDDDYAAKNSNEYNDLVNLYMHYKINGSTFPLKMTDYFEFGTQQILKGLTKQVFLTRQMITFAERTDSIYQAMYQKFVVHVSDAQLRQIIVNSRAGYLKKLSESNLSPENISQSSSLNEIFKKYKGKVIYVDFWASWCGPCRGEMPSANQLKAKLKGKDIVFVYLGYQDQKINWLAARKELEISGEHYLLSPALIKEAASLFQISGIPHYAIIDKNGNILEKNAARPSVVYEQLLNISKTK